MSYTIDLDWKSFQVELQDLDRWVRSNTQNYAGMSANSKCEIHFTSAPSEDMLARVNQYWNSLTEQEETAKIAYRDKLDRTVEYAISNLPYVDFMQMIVAEKKLFMGQQLSLQEKEALVAKYPNV